MWKWILGAVVLVVLLIGSGMWYGFRKMTQLADGDSTATTTIAASSERVFSFLADGDSIGDWMVGGRMRPSRTGQLRRGDTLFVEQGDSTRLQHMNWIVGEVAPGRSFAMRLESDSLNVIAISRRYTVLGQGDSTVVFSTVTSPMMDSVKVAETNRGNSAMVELTAKLMLGAMRMQNKLELARLKARIEGGAGAVAPVRPSP